MLRLQLPSHAGHLLVSEGHHGHAGLQALPALTLAVLLLVLDAALANLLVPLPGIFPCGRLGVVVYVVTATKILESDQISVGPHNFPVLASNFMSQPGGRELLSSAMVSDGSLSSPLTLTSHQLPY